MTVAYEPCPDCEGQGFLLQISPRYNSGETAGGEMFMLFSINPSRAQQVQCYRCEGLGRVPQKERADNGKG